MQKFVRILPVQTLVMFTDAYDVFFSGTVPQFVQAFRKMDTQLVMSTELDPFPEIRGTLRKAYEAKFGASAEWRAANSKYANSGTYMGTAVAIGNFLDWVQDAPITHSAHCRADYTTGESVESDGNHVSHRQ